MSVLAAVLPVPWWAFWLGVSLAGFAGLVWFMVREALATDDEQAPSDEPSS